MPVHGEHLYARPDRLCEPDNGVGRNTGGMCVPDNSYHVGRIALVV